MNTVILRSLAPYLAALMVLFSIFILLRGHNDPGGGFIGGLIAASGFAIFGIAYGVKAVRGALPFHPIGIAAFGLFIALLSAFASILFADAFMTSQWFYITLLGVEVPLSTPLVFDIGVYLVVVGTFTSIALTLEEGDGE